MKSFIVLALFVAAAVAAPPTTNDRDAQVIRSDNNNIGIGPYQIGYETSNGIVLSEVGELTNVGTENEALEVRGQFSYVGPDGITYSVAYTSGREGFKPIGDHIPVAP